MPTFLHDDPEFIRYSICHIEPVKVKGKAEHLYSTLLSIQTTLKRSDMDHTVKPARNTMPAFVS